MHCECLKICHRECLEAPPSPRGWTSTPHSLLSSPESDRARDAAPVPLPCLDRCPGSQPGMYPRARIHLGCAHGVGIPHGMSLQSCCAHTQLRSDPVHQREHQLPLGSTATAPPGPSCLCPAPVHFSSHRESCSSAEGGRVTTPAHRTVSKKVFAESTEDEFGFWLASWSQSSTKSSWHRGSPSFPFHSRLERQTGRFL